MHRKKLRLDREALTDLTAPELGAVAGAGPTRTCTETVTETATATFTGHTFTCNQCVVVNTGSIVCV